MRLASILGTFAGVAVAGLGAATVRAVQRAGERSRLDTRERLGTAYGHAHEAAGEMNVARAVTVLMVAARELGAAEGRIDWTDAQQRVLHKGVEDRLQAAANHVVRDL